MRSIRATSYCLLLALSGVAYPQEDTADRSTNARPQSGGLDSQLLEGLGDKPAATDAPAAGSASQSGDRVVPAPEGVIDPFSKGSDLGQQNPLARIGQQMRRVEDLLSQRNVSSQTRQSQHQIVMQLDDLIAALAASQLAQKQRKKTASSQDSQQTSKTGRDAAQGGGGRPTDATAADQSSTFLQGATGAIWGHLPERLRRQMRSAEAIEFLPKYRKLIEDYYKRLAADRGIQQ